MVTYRGRDPGELAQWFQAQKSDHDRRVAAANEAERSAIRQASELTGAPAEAPQRAIERQLREEAAATIRHDRERAALARVSQSPSPAVADPTAVFENRASELRRDLSALGSAPTTTRVKRWLIFKRSVPTERPGYEKLAAGLNELDDLLTQIETDDALRASAAYQLAYKRAKRERQEALAGAELDFRTTKEEIRRSLDGWVEHAHPMAYAEWESCSGDSNEAGWGTVRVGTFDLLGASVSIPATLELPGQAVAVELAEGQRDKASNLVTNVALRAFLSLPAGAARLIIIDPVGLGESAAPFLELSRWDTGLIDAKVWTQEREIQSKLDELTAHVETVIQRYLRSQFRTLDEYNEHAGEVGEPYRLVVVYDFPTGFTDHSARQLRSLVENGPRCGVNVILAHTEHAQSRGLEMADVTAAAQRIVFEGNSIRISNGRSATDIPVLPDPPAPVSFGPEGQALSPVAESLADLASAAQSGQSENVTIERVFDLMARLRSTPSARLLPEPATTRTEPTDTATWWEGDSRSAVAVPIGRTGAQELAMLRFDSEEEFSGLVVGVPGMGKTTLFHAAILGLCTIYPPDELELYLLDSKQGVEFKVYEQLPHARIVGIRNEREFGLEVLRELVRERDRRAARMKQNSGDQDTHIVKLPEFRNRSGERMPRVLLVADEFQELFQVDDRVGREAGDLLDDLIRQGRSYGIHVLLGTQSIGNTPALDRSTLGQVPVRIAFACTESDADTVMGHDNKDVRFLHEAGQGIMNPKRGVPEANVRFRGVFVDSDQRRALVSALTAHARRAGFDRSPLVFDGDSPAQRDPAIFRSAIDPRRPTALQIPLGEPFGLGGSVFVILRREPGANLAVVGRPPDDVASDTELVLPELSHGGPVDGFMHSLLTVMAASKVDVQLVNFVADATSATGVELERAASELGVVTPRRSQLAQTIEHLKSEVDDRHATEDFRAPALVLVLHGVERAADLDPEDYASSEPLSKQLTQLMKAGPEVGVHTIVVAQSPNGLQRRLGREGLSQVAVRVTGRLSADDSRDFLGATGAGDLRPNQLLLADRSRDDLRVVRAFSPVGLSWFEMARLGVDS